MARKTEEEEEEEELREETTRTVEEDEKKEENDGHINTYATQTKTHKGPALAADTILRHADTSILISPRGLSKETVSFCCIRL